MFKYFVSFIILTVVVACSKDMPLNVFDNDDLSKIAYSPTAFNLKIPTNFPQMDIPANNPLTTEGVELGRRLFYDPILSRDSSLSCASCHLSVGSFTDNLAFSKGVDGLNGSRSSMSLENIGFVNKGLFWDGRAKTLEEQALIPLKIRLKCIIFGKKRFPKSN